jgi:hypothetical protein
MLPVKNRKIASTS